MRHGPAFWHFARPALARSYLEQAEAGIQTLTLFAARGAGKTEFVKRDLIPAAQAAGYRAIYCDLWSQPSNPVAALIAELKAALDGQPTHARVPTLFERARRLGNRKVKRIEGGAEVAGAKINAGLELHAPPPVADDEIAALNELFTQLMLKSRKPVYLVLDEVQSLADAKYEGVVKALRATFQRYDDRIVRVFTGSSRAGLDRLFHRAKAALFQQGGSRTPFPMLGKNFVVHMAERYRELTGAMDFDVEAAWEGFKRMRYSARLFREALNRLLTGDSPDIAHACAAVRASPSTDQAQLARWDALTPLDQAVLLFLLESGEKPFSAGSRARISEISGAPITIETWEVQSALERLETQSLVYRGEWGVYAIEDEEFRVWMEHRLEEANARGGQN